MVYGSNIWRLAPENRWGRDPQLKDLCVVQNKALKAITGAFKATSKKVIEAEVEIPPLDLYLDETLLRAKTKQNNPQVEA